MSDTRAIRLTIEPNVLAALERYVKNAKVLDDAGELRCYADGRPVILDVAAAFHLIADAAEAKLAREGATLEQHVLEKSVLPLAEGAQ